MKKYKRGFTLAEIMLSMMIIGVIMALSVGTIKSVKSSYTSLAYFAHKNVVDMVGILFSGTLTSTDRTRRTCTPGAYISQDGAAAQTGGFRVGEGKKCPASGYFYTNQKLGVDQLRYGDTPLQPMVTQCKINVSTHKGYGKLVSVLKNDYENTVGSSNCVSLDSLPGRLSGSEKNNLFCKSLVALTNNSGSYNCSTLYETEIKSGETEPVFKNFNANSPNFRLTNGMRVYLSEWDFNSIISNVYGYRLIGVDLNGKSGPNKLYDGTQTPADIITFLVLDNGEVYPLGIAADNLVDKKGKTLQYLNARVKGYHFNYYSAETCTGTGASATCTKTRITNRTTVPQECLNAKLPDKFKCNFGVVPVKNPAKSANGKNLSSFTYRQAFCNAKNDDNFEYLSYCTGIEKNADCPPSSSTSAFDMCKAETLKPVFRYNF